MDLTTEVVLCTYNGERFVAEQLLSILRQTKRVDKISIHDDASTDWYHRRHPAPYRGDPGRRSTSAHNDRQRTDIGLRTELRAGDLAGHG